MDPKRLSRLCKHSASHNKKRKEEKNQTDCLPQIAEEISKQSRWLGMESGRVTKKPPDKPTKPPDNPKPKPKSKKPGKGKQKRQDKREGAESKIECYECGGKHYVKGPEEKRA